MNTFLRTVAAVLIVSGGAAQTSGAQCVDDPAGAVAPQFDVDFLFAGLDQSLGGQFPQWLARYNRINTGDPSPAFRNEDNCQNGIRDDDHVDLLAAMLAGEPVAGVLGGIDPAHVADIRAGYAANRARVRPDLTLQIIFVTVNIIDEINKDDPDFGASLQDLVAAYMTIGDAESVAFIRGLLITLGEIFIEQGVQSGDIPGIVEGLTKNTLRDTVNANFVGSRYDCFGDASGTTRPNLLGDSGNIGGSANTNETEYTLQGGDRQAWLAAKGVTLPPLEIAVPPVDTVTGAGEPAALTALVLGGDAAATAYDWKRVDSETGQTTRTGTGPALEFGYPVPADSGLFALYVCDGTWIRQTLPVEFTVTPAPFSITEQPVGAQRLTGESHTFRVNVRGGTAPPDYEWLFGANPGALAPLPGATGPVLTLDNLALSDGGVYRARITGDDGAGPVTLESGLATLSVSLPPDITPPVLTLLGANPLVVECGDSYTEPGATAEDDRDGNLTDAIAVEGPVNTGAPGEYTVTYRVQDAAGNSAEATRTVRVGDTVPPLIALFGDNPVVLECGAPYAEQGFEAQDVCDGGLTAVVQVSGNVDTGTPGDYVLAYTVADAAGNPAETARVVAVRDTTPPVMALVGPASLQVECGSAFTDLGATAFDTCAGVLDASITVEGAVDNVRPGVYLLEYTATDPAGNRASIQRTVTVADKTPPQILLLGENPAFVTCGEPFTDPGAEAGDACGGPLPAASIAVTGAVNVNSPGVYTLTYSVTDPAGNAAQGAREVHVVDDAAPEIVLQGANPLRLSCGQPFNDPGARATDACEGDLSAAVTVSGTVDVQTPGSYTLVYEVEDRAGNTGTASRTVEVSPDGPPRITLLGGAAITVECGGAYVEPGFSAAEACGGSLDEAVEVSGSVNASVTGAYVLTYRVENAQGVSAETVRTVTVADTTPPLVTLLGDNPLEVSCGTAYIDPGAEAPDGCAGDRTSFIEMSGVVETGTPGTYTVTYTADDGNGNAGRAERTVVVRDDCPIAVTRQPRSLALYTGLPARFQLAASGGAGPLSYRWHKDGEPLDAPALPALSIAAVALEDAGAYTCEVSDGAASVVSVPALLTVFERPEAGAHAADSNGDWSISLAELLRVIQFFNSGGFGCAPDTEDGYAPGGEDRSCANHASDYAPANWRIELSELLRVIQFFNTPAGLYRLEQGTEDGYAPGPG